MAPDASRSVLTGTCDQTCITCCGYSVAVTPGNFVMAVGETMACQFQGTDCNGGTIDFAANWSSSNSSVMSVDGSGNVTGVGAGTATITGQMTQFIDVYSGQVCSTGTPSCPTGEPQANTPGTAHRPTSLIVACPTGCDFYITPPPSAYLYDRHRIYQILDEAGNPMAGYAPNGLYVSEAYSPNPANGNCGNQNITMGIPGFANGQGQFYDDYVIQRSPPPPNPCSGTSTQSYTVNGNQVTTFSVTWTDLNVDVH